MHREYYRSFPKTSRENIWPPINAPHSLSYLISRVLVKVLPDVHLRHGESHVVVHVASADARPRPFSTGPAKDSIELLTNASVPFRHQSRSVHHETPDEIVLHGSRRRLVDDRRGIAQEIQFTDRDDIVLAQCDIRRGIEAA